MIFIARWFLIILAIILSPFYLLWLAGGKIADWKEKRRLHKTEFNLVNGQWDEEWRR